VPPLLNEPTELMAKRLLTAINDTGFFLQEWFANPQRTGAIAPSSPKLAAAMAQWLPEDPESYVLELGPGTGAVTQALLERGLREDRLVAIDNNPRMAMHLRERFSRAQIITGDAWEMDELLRDRPVPIPSVGAVISSLPLLNFPKHDADALTRKIRSVLAPGGHWVQYSYHIGKDRVPGAADFQVLASNVIWLNLPPARVSVFQA
jgi:phosphatidylethanolamine/phosphatidyl-N-methylethanolamine N-methyltransferase